MVFMTLPSIFATRPCCVISVRGSPVFITSITHWTIFESR